MSIDDEAVPEGQQELPLGVLRAPGTPRPDDVASWPGYRMLEDHPANHLGPARVPVRTSGGVTLRWALRLTLPPAIAAALLHVFPYRGVAAGVHFRVEGSILARPGLTADTTVGSWEFPNVDGLPVGLHVSPVDVDLLRLAARRGDTQAFTDQLQSDVSRQVPAIIWWVGGEALLGILLGLLLAAVVNMAVRYQAGLGRRPSEIGYRARQFGAALAVVAMVATYGVLSYDPDWTRQSRLTGTLGAAQLVPDQLARYYGHESKVFDVLGAISGIQSRLQQQIEANESQPSAFNIMYVSDMHLAATYPLVAQYAKNFDVKLIVNTGDESEFGQNVELTRSYLDQLRALTRTVPMIWLAGNHDSPEIVQAMRRIPGVVVVGRKTAERRGGYRVSAEQVSVFGLTIGAVPDPRVYGGEGRYGSDTPSVTDPLERDSIDGAVLGATGQFDIFATHEPVAARQVEKDLPGRVRQTAAGHTHAQNPAADVQDGSVIRLVEGSTGAGGLDNINRGVAPPPVEFSVQSVAADCQFTKIVRFQLADPGRTPSTFGQQVTASTIYLSPQKIADGRRCGTDLPRSPVSPLVTDAAPVPR